LAGSLRPSRRNCAIASIKGAGRCRSCRTGSRSRSRVSPSRSSGPSSGAASLVSMALPPVELDVGPWPPHGASSAAVVTRAMLRSRTPCCCSKRAIDGDGTSERARGLAGASGRCPRSRPAVRSTTSGGVRVGSHDSRSPQASISMSETPLLGEGVGTSGKRAGPAWRCVMAIARSNLPPLSGPPPSAPSLGDGHQAPGRPATGLHARRAARDRG
jgi:hypothetical protein